MTTKTSLFYGSVQVLLGADGVLLGAVRGRSKIVHKGGGGWRRSALGSGAPLDEYTSNDFKILKHW